MPVIYVYGTPDFIEPSDLVTLLQSLRRDVESIPELGLKQDQVTVFFPRDLVQEGLGEEIVIEVNGLFEKPGRTEEVRKRLAAKLVSTCDAFFKPHTNQMGLSMIECFVHPFKPEGGFCQLKISG